MRRTDFTIRPATLQDQEEVLALIRQHNLADYGEATASAAYLIQTWNALDLAADTWLATTPDRRLAAYAEVQCDAGHTEFYPSIYVAPEYRGLGIGTQLLQQVEARAAARAGPPNGFSLVCRLSVRNRTGQRILERRGYRLWLTFNIMETALHAPPPPPAWPPGIHAHPFVPGVDDQAVYRADEDASQDKGYHQPLDFAAWAQRMGLHAADFDPALWFLAWDGDEIAGVALNLYAGESATAWVDHLGVRRPWRRQGLGLALLRHSLAAFHARGIPRARLSVDSHSLTHAPLLYERAGFATIQGYHVYRKEM